MHANTLLTAAFTGEDLHILLLDAAEFGEKTDKLLIGATLNRRGANFDFQCVAMKADDLIFFGPRL